MNIVQFLTSVDQQCEQKNHSELSIFIHEYARKLPAEQRNGFLTALNQAGVVQPHLRGKQRQLFLKQYDIIKENLNRIQKGNLWIEKEVNEEYDDWYDDPDNEIYYHDHANFSKDIKTAYRYLLKCLKYRESHIGRELATNLLNLKVTAINIKWEEKTGDQVPLEDLDEKLTGIHPQKLSILAAYMTYFDVPLKKRPRAIYQVMKTSRYQIRLENLMQVGQELPDFADFLPLWITYLGRTKSPVSQELLNEAIKLSGDQTILLRAARKHVKTHPGLYEQYISNQLEKGLASPRVGQHLLQIGDEALKTIDEKYIVRSKIAVMLAKLAAKFGTADQEEQYLFVAFASHSTLANYFQLRFNCHDFTKYEEQVDQTIKKAESRWEQNEYGFMNQATELHENQLSDTAANLLFFFQGDFQSLIANKICKGSFVKCGVPAFLLLLSDSKVLSVGGLSMCELIVRELSLFDFIEEKPITAKELGKDFLQWQRTVKLTTEQKLAFYQQFRELVEKRVVEVMKNNNRRAYDECAALVSMLGEASVALGLSSSKQDMLEQYHSRYSRRSAFHRALKEYGLKK